jgi:endonuclease-3
MDARTRSMIGTLRKRYKTDKVRMDPFRVLIHVILAARTTDDVSWPAADRLIAKGKDVEGIAGMDIREIQKTILPSNFYRNKARYVKSACKMVVEDFGGKVPKTREELMKLPGVGGKSADIILSFSYGQPVIAVDAHVKWVATVLGMTKEKEPENIRRDLHTIFPEKERSTANYLMVQFGKEICRTGRPMCWVCPVRRLCPYPKKRSGPKSTGP